MAQPYFTNTQLSNCRKRRHNANYASTSSMASSSVVVVFFLLAMTVDQASSLLTLQPLHQAIQVGQDAVFVCTRHDGNHSAIVWTHGDHNNGTNAITTIGGNDTTTSSNGGGGASELLWRHRVTNNNGTLTIHNSTASDKGKYFCWLDTQRGTKLEAYLVVYVMPDYLVHIYVMSGVCAALLMLLVVLMITKWCLHGHDDDNDGKGNKGKRRGGDVVGNGGGGLKAVEKGMKGDNTSRSGSSSDGFVMDTMPTTKRDGLNEKPSV